MVSDDGSGGSFVWDAYQQGRNGGPDDGSGGAFVRESAKTRIGPYDRLPDLRDAYPVEIDWGWGTSVIVLDEAGADPDDAMVSVPRWFETCMEAIESQDLERVTQALAEMVAWRVDAYCQTHPGEIICTASPRPGVISSGHGAATDHPDQEP
jgi:hypothetical protein